LWDGGIVAAEIRLAEHYTREAMRREDILALFDFTYWANRQILRAAASVPPAEFVAPIAYTYRDLRGTLVHTLDVELSWRRRLRGEPREVWDVTLADSTFATVDLLAKEWARDEAEMRTWLQTLDDDQLSAVVDLGNEDRFPLWYYLVHIVTHSTSQRRDAAIILENLGHSPPELEFLYYADSLTG
jgi:uncharacterized damage-inducible protein DinB